MKDAYQLAFFDIVKSSSDKNGYELPEQVEAYVVMLLANYVERTNFLPEESFAEAYMKLSQPYNYSAKELGDTCLFVTGVFPTYGSSKGINRSYYQNIGSSSYEMVAKTMHGELFDALATHFIFLSEFIEITVSSSKQQNYNLFR